MFAGYLKAFASGRSDGISGNDILDEGNGNALKG
jgi:hypothetical protein